MRMSEEDGVEPLLLRICRKRTVIRRKPRKSHAARVFDQDMMIPDMYGFLQGKQARIIKIARNP